MHTLAVFCVNLACTRARIITDPMPRASTQKERDSLHIITKEAVSCYEAIKITLFFTQLHRIHIYTIMAWRTRAFPISQLNRVLPYFPAGSISKLSRGVNSTMEYWH